MENSEVENIGGDGLEADRLEKTTFPDRKHIG